MPETDQEVFGHFRDGYGDTKDVALMAYARYAEAKYDWMFHQFARLQRYPNEREVTQWGGVETAAQRVERATSFWRTFVPNLFIGVVASFVFTLIVLVGAAIYHRDPSPFALFREWQTTPPASH